MHLFQWLVHRLTLTLTSETAIWPLLPFLRRRASNLSVNAKSVIVATFYGGCSLSMNFLNKIILSSYGFNFPFFIMICQMSVILLGLESLRLLGRLNLPPLSLREARQLLPASACFALHAALSLTALHGMNIPMYGAIKRCGPIVNLVLSVVVLRKRVPSRWVVFSIILMVLGCLVASLGDLQFDRHAYLIGTLSVFANAGYQTLIERSSSLGKRTTLQMMHVNSCSTLPFFVVCAVLAGEHEGVWKAECLKDHGFHLTLLFVVLWSCLLNFSQFFCVSYCTALTTSLVGVGKAVALTAAGFVAFGGVKFHPLIVTGLFLNLFGGFLYTNAKYREGKEKPNAKQDGCNGTVIHRESTELLNYEQLKTSEVMRWLQNGKC